jgi:hypothetical protein
MYAVLPRMSGGGAALAAGGAAGGVAQLQATGFWSPPRMSQPESESATAAPAKARMTRMSASSRR